MAKKGSKSGSHASIQDWLKRQPAEDRPTLRQNVTRLKKLYGRQQYDDFVWWHDIGSLVAKLCPKEDRHYGNSVVNLLAQHLEPDQKLEGTRNFLYSARDLAEKFTDAEASELTEAGLLKSQVKALLTVKSPAKRKQFTEECVEKGWSYRQLCRRIQNAQGRKSRSGGRRLRSHKGQSAGVAARNITVMSSGWLEHHKVWFQGPQAAFSRVKKKDCDEEILHDAQSALVKLKEVHDVIGEEVDGLQAFVEQLEEKLAT